MSDLGDDEGREGHVAAAGPLQRLRRRFRRQPRALLLLGLAALLAPLWLTLPVNQPVRLTLRRPTNLTRIELAWLEEEGRVPLRRTTYHFPPGAAPAQIQTELRAPRGRYLLEVLAVRGEHEQPEEYAVEVGLLSPQVDLVLP